MSIKETAEAFVAAIENLDIKAAAPHCANNFTFSGPLPEPVGIEAWIGIAEKFINAFPDWKYNFEVGEVEGNVVHLTVGPTGTHTGDLDLSALGQGVIPATGNSFVVSRGTSRVTFEGDKIANLHVDVAPDGGIPGILNQLGVE